MKQPKKFKSKTLIKKTSSNNLDMGSFLLGKDLISSLSGSEAQSFIDYLSSKGLSESKAGQMDFNSINSYYKRFKGSMN